MASRKLNRRALLTGAGGIAIGLPLLEIMQEGRGISFAADPPVIPKRYLVCFGGQSLGSVLHEVGDPALDVAIVHKQHGTQQRSSRPLVGDDARDHLADDGFEIGVPPALRVQ